MQNKKLIISLFSLCLVAIVGLLATVIVFAATSQEIKSGITINYTAIYISQFFMGMGFGMFAAPNTNAVMSYVKANQYNQASGMIAVFRQTGMMMSMGLATCLISIFMGTDAVIEPSNYETFVDILRYAWSICIVFSIVGILFSWFRGADAE